MPCPPSAEEQQMTSEYSKHSYYRASITECEKAFPQTWKLVNLVFGLAEKSWQKKWKKELTRVGETHKETIETGITPLPVDDFEYSRGYPGPEDVNALRKYNTKLEKITSQQEIDLCILRDIIMKTWLLQKVEGINDDFLEELEAEKKLHLIHRLEDKNQVIINFERTNLYVQKDIYTQQLTASSVGLEEDLKRLWGNKEKLYRLYCYTDKEILLDRYLF